MTSRKKSRVVIRCVFLCSVADCLASSPWHSVALCVSTVFFSVHSVFSVVKSNICPTRKKTQPGTNVCPAAGYLFFTDAGCRMPDADSSCFSDTKSVKPSLLVGPPWAIQLTASASSRRHQCLVCWRRACRSPDQRGRSDRAGASGLPCGTDRGHRRCGW